MGRRFLFLGAPPGSATPEALVVSVHVGAACVGAPVFFEDGETGEDKPWRDNQCALTLSGDCSRGANAQLSTSRTLAHSGTATFCTTLNPDGFCSAIRGFCDPVNGYSGMKGGGKVKVRILAVAAVLALAGCTTVGPGGQVQRAAGAHALWSFLIPGVGQFMNGEVGKGALMMGVNVANNVYLMTSVPETLEEAQQIAAISLVVSLGVSVWSAGDAYSSTNRFNQTLGSRTYRSRAPAEPETTPLTVCLDLINKRLLMGVDYRF